MTGLPPETFQRIGGGGDHAEAAASNLSFFGTSQSWLVDWATGGPNANQSEVRVNEFTALNNPALYTCVRLIANTVASLPVRVYRRRADGSGQDEQRDHPAAALLQREYNPNTSAVVGRQAQIGHLLTWGNSYTQIVRRRNGELLRLQTLGPDLVTPDTETATGDLFYTVRDRESGTVYRLTRDEVLHVPFYTFDSLVGLSTVRLARGLIRQGLGQDRQAERFVTAGLRAPGALRFREGSKFKSAAEAIQFRDRFRAIHNKADGDQEILILEDGAEWQQLGVDPESAQLLQSRSFTRDEIAALYQVPPVMIGGSANTYNGTGVEELNIWFATYCLMPILELLEQEYNRKLFPTDPDLFVKHELKGLLRGDTLKRSQALQVQMQSGIITVNEWRKLEGYNPVDGGDVRYFPLNMGRVGTDGEDLDPPPPANRATTTPPAPAGAHHLFTPAVLLAALRKQLTAGVGRCLRKEAAEAIKAARKPAEFVTLVDEFYKRHAEQVRETYDTPLTEGYAERHLSRSHAELLAAAECPAAQLLERVTKTVEKWPTDRVAEIIGGLSDAA